MGKFHKISVRSSTMQQHLPSRHAGWRHLLWLALLVGAGIGFSLGFACAIPFAALAAATALTLSRRDALMLIVSVWFSNQVIGFTALAYPWTPSTFAWGAVLGAVAVIATSASQWAADRSVSAARAVGSAVTFLFAFAVYEAALFTASIAWLGGTEVFTGAIQGRIFAINAAAFIGLLALHRIALSVGLVTNTAAVASMAERHA
jgi:hypothetical protein